MPIKTESTPLALAGGLAFAIAALLAARSAMSQSARVTGRPPEARVVPAGQGWWCLDQPGATGLCERTHPACQTALQGLPWGGLAPLCVRRPSASCVTYAPVPAGQTRRDEHACRRDLAGCNEVRQSLVRDAIASSTFEISNCGSVR